MMPKVIDGTWKGEIGQRQIREWEKENAGKPIDTRTNYEKLMDEKAGVSPVKPLKLWNIKCLLTDFLAILKEAS